MNNDVFLKLKQADKIIVGISGGADSIALTHILFKQFGVSKLICVHVNHGIRGDEALRDENFVLEFCKKFNIRFEIIHADIPKLCKETGRSSEECGRKVRYDAFNKFTTENCVVATAHNADDNAETVIFNLIRGTGIKGMCGIPVIRGNIVRPVLHMTRNEIENYCKTENLDYIVDSTNLENDYSRNKIRNLILPVFKEINENAVSNINRSSQNFQDNYGFISQKSIKILNLVKSEFGLNTKELNKLSDYMLKQVIYTFLKGENIYTAESKHINQIALMIRQNSGAVVLPSNKEIVISQNILFIKKEKNFLKNYIYIEKPLKYGDKIVYIEKKDEIYVKINNLLFKNLVDCDKILCELSVSPRKDGERFVQANRGISKSLKKLFNEAKIPTNIRNELIIIRDGENIVYIEGFGVSENYKVTKDTKNILEIKISKGKD
ncbi:MAG: tRNA lysidine(34) synthetase TilS [Clostridia bacterium]